MAKKGDDDFQKEVHESFEEDMQADRENREEMVLDLKMAAFDQWHPEIKQLREEHEPFPLPCLTINTTNQFVNQVVGDRRANQTSIKVLPREDGDKDVAEVRSELIRSIELQSRADRVYTLAFTHAVSCGQGAFEVALDWAYDDAFDRDLFIRGIPNPMSVLFDSTAADPTARDACRAWKMGRMRLEDYKREYPKAALPSMFDTDVLTQGWSEKDGSWVRTAELWRLEERPRTIAMMQDGSVLDVTDKPKNGRWRNQVLTGPDGEPRIRRSMCKYATMVITNGQEQLTDPFELKIPRLPIIRVMGQEVWVGDKRTRFGLIRGLRDPQQLKNYWRSAVAEQLMGATRANFIASAESIKGREDDWPNTLVYTGSTAPTEVTGSNLAAIINEAQMCAQDMKDVTGLHDASLGMRSNETSGVAIQRRQNEGDIATIAYHDNMNAAMQDAGEVINALIPIVYDTPRTIRVVGANDAVKLLRINDTKHPDSVDLATGRYDVTISTGPAYATRRQEAAAQLMDLARNNQAMMAQAGDLIVKALDVPDGDQLADRLRPQGVADGDEDQTPEQQAAQAVQKQMAERAQQMQMAGAEAELRTKIAEARKAEAQADEAEAKAALEKTKAQEAQAAQLTTGAALAHAADMPGDEGSEGGMMPGIAA